MSLRATPTSSYWGKRAFDVVCSAIALVLLTPLLTGIWILVRGVLGSPVLFRQLRPGLHGEPFEILKFRTMTDARGVDGSLLADGARLTRLGRFLRRTSLDELPELWNVLRGDMSLVGPRPLLMEYLPHYTQRERQRHDVRPGITGLAQVAGRNTVGWDERLEFDVQYVENVSFGLDLNVLGKTLVMVLGGIGVAEDVDEVETRLDGERSSVGSISPNSTKGAGVAVERSRDLRRDPS